MCVSSEIHAKEHTNEIKVPEPKPIGAFRLLRNRKLHMRPRAVLQDAHVPNGEKVSIISMYKSTGYGGKLEERIQFVSRL